MRLFTKHAANPRASLGPEPGLVIAIYTLLAGLVTWPVTPHLFTAIAGFEGRDALQLVWFNWWGVKSLLDLGQSPAQVDWLYYPQGAPHYFLLASFFLPLLALPLTLAAGPIPTYNLIVLSSFVLAGLLTYLLALGIVRNRRAALVAGLIFIFAPNRMGHVLAGHLLLFVTWSLPLYALALTYLLRRPSWPWAVVGGLALAILTLTQPLHLAYFALPLTVIYGGGLLLARPHPLATFRSLLPYTGAMAGLAALLLLPFYRPLLSATWQGELDFFSNVGLEDHSTDLAAFVLPSPYHPLWNGDDRPPELLARVIASPRDMEERLAYLGLAPLGLTVWALIRRPRQVYLWAILAFVAAVFALGPTLYVLRNDTGIPLPYTWLIELPFLKWSRTPGRFNETVMLAIAIMAAAGLAEGLARIRSGLGAGLLTGLVSLVILFEYLILFPFPLAGQNIPPFYSRLAREAPGQPLLDMPVTGSRRASNYSLLYQTIHNRPIAGGYIQRELPGTGEMAQFFDRLLSPARGEGLVEGLPSPATRQQILRESGIQQVVARRWLMTDQAARATLEFMPTVLGPAYYVGDDLLAWQTPPGEAALPPYTLLLSEQGWEATGDGDFLFLDEQGQVFVYSTAGGPATLTIALRAEQPGQQLWVDGIGPFPADGANLRYQAPLEMGRGFDRVLLRLTGCERCRAQILSLGMEETD